MYTYCLNNPLKYTDPSGYRYSYQDYQREKAEYASQSGAAQFFNNYVGWWQDLQKSYSEGAWQYYVSSSFTSQFPEGTVINNLSPVTTGTSYIKEGPSGYYIKYASGTLPVRIGKEGDPDFRVFFSMDIVLKFVPFSSIYQAQSAWGSDGISTTNNINTGLGIGSGIFAGNYGLTANQTFRYAQRINGRVVSAAELTAAHTAQSMKVANGLGRVSLVTGVFGTAYSVNNVINDYQSGGWEKVNGWDVSDALVGGGGVAAGIFLASNPIGWGISIGVGIYFGARLVYDLSKN